MYYEKKLKNEIHEEHKHAPQEVGDPCGPATLQNDNPIGGGLSIATTVCVFVQE